MRVISGSLKGKSFSFLKNSNTRPLKDSVRENIFNILQHSNLIKPRIENSNILDLYSGIGSFGIECISRGARKATFIEQDLSASKILKQNLTNLSIIEKSKIFNDKIENVLNQKVLEQFSIFFLDPPFKDLEFYKNLDLIKKSKIFNINHIIIVHREKDIKENFEESFKVVEQKVYGRSKIIFGVFT